MKKVLHIQLMLALLIIGFGAYTQPPPPPPPPLGQTHCVVHASPRTVSSCGGVPITLSATDTVKGSAISFNGFSSQYVSIPNSTSLTSYSSELTVSAWVYLSNPATNQKVISFLTNSLNDGFVLAVQNGGVYPEVKDITSTTYAFGNAGSITANTWTHIAFTYKANDSMRVYVNGAVVAAQASGSDVATNSGDLTFGIASWDHQSFRTTGRVDEVRMYSRALDPAEMAASYNVSISGQTQGLIGYWPLDEGSGTTVADAANNGNIGSLVSSPAWVTPSILPLTYPVTFSWSPATGLSNPTAATTTATISQSTTYYITVSDTTTGCSATDSVVVHYGSSSAPASVSASANLICRGDTATITATGFASISWAPGGQSSSRITVSPGTATQYIATGTDSGGCQHIDTVSISIKPNIATNAIATPTIICHGDSATLTVYGLSPRVWSLAGNTSASIRVSPSASSVYTVSGLDSNSCRHIDTVSVALHAIPSVTASATPSSICPGDTTTITGGGLSNYLWMPGSISTASFRTAPAGTTTYALSGTDANGCHGAGTAVVTVTTLPTAPTVAYTGGSLITTASATHYQWYRNGGIISGATSASYATTQGGSYTLEITNGSGCTAMSAAYIISGISDVAGMSLLSLYPNPTNGMLHISMENAGTFELTVADATGRILISTTGEGKDSAIDLSTLSAGTYLVQVRGSQVNGTAKITKD